MQRKLCKKSFFFCSTKCTYSIHAFIARSFQIVSISAIQLMNRNSTYCSCDFISNPFQMLHCSRAYFCLSLSAQYNSKYGIHFLRSVHLPCRTECNLPAAKTIDVLIWFHILFCLSFFNIFSFQQMDILARQYPVQHKPWKLMWRNRIDSN